MYCAVLTFDSLTDLTTGTFTVTGVVDGTTGTPFQGTWFMVQGGTTFSTDTILYQAINFFSANAKSDVLGAQDLTQGSGGAQAERGQAAYRQSCQDCHGSSLDNGEFGGPPLKGGYFRTRWGQGNVAALYGYVSLAMPPDRPGQLSPQTYADLVAFLLSNNGYPPGDKELPTDQNAQQTMSLKR